MNLASDIKDRITAAANALYDEAARSAFPTVAEVRARAGSDMNAASLVMREWRRAQTVQAAPVAVEVPDKVRAANSTALAALWSEAQALANERLLAAQTAWDAERVEAEALRAELSEAFEGQRGELDAAQAKIAAQAEQIARMLAEGDLLRAHLMKVTQRASTAETRTTEIEHRANDLAVELQRVHVVGTAERERQAIELAQERKAAQGQIHGHVEEIARQHADSEALRAALAAAAEGAKTAQMRLVEIERRADNLTAELGRVHSVAAAERERQAVERAQIIRLTSTNQKIETMQAQIADLMRALTPAIAQPAESKPARSKPIK